MPRFVFAFLACVLLPSLLAAAGQYHALRDGLKNFPAAVHAQQQGRVAFLGGSITQMPGWRDGVTEDLKARFPQAALDFVQAGVASMGSTPGAFRLERDVFARGPVDLLFVEAAVNDSTNLCPPQQMIRGMEGIARHARLLNPKIDIVFMYFADPEKLAAYNEGTTPEVILQHERVAEFYALPSLNLALEVTERIRAGEFSWEGDFKDLHPSPFGHELYRRSIARLLDAAWNSPPGTAAPYMLPAKPLDNFSYTHPAIVPIGNAIPVAGFRFVDQWQPTDGKGTRPGFTDVPMLVAESPGASLTFAFEGIAAGIWVAAGPDAGAVAWQIDGAPEQTLDLFTPWSAGLHLPWSYVLADELPPGPHALSLRILPEKNRESSGTAVRIAHFLVNRPAM
ncbi:MAG: hypothetical protein HYV27_00515 [Candidatus Hydrogenedentes bacterium]|nr:hypothetical protein [Candidatus Hydrogenedentota bacterium]